ncbi:rhodanese-like domain-containing protein [Psychroserpens mesophilus]|uniref:rhodanese-like domain-containing protein n=1 Tax=Psychroserpens mesophilus TaxID=325473 RepID=UPI003D64D009
MSFLSAIFGDKSIQNECITVLSPIEFKSQVDGKNVQLIDVRTSNEFNSNHIKGAKNIDFFSGSFNLELNKLNKDKPVYVYCRSGSRSRQTANKLANMEFKKIYDLRGGILNY